MVDKQIGRSQLRSFGFIVAGGFTVIAFWPLVFRGNSPRMWALTIAALLATMALVCPPALKPVLRVWTVIGETLGWVNTRIILGVTYFGLIVPMGAILRLVGKDPMHRKYDRRADTYRVRRTKRPASHMQHQY